jgi:hypothetical protein
LTPDLLNEHQRKALAIVLRQLEMALRGVLADLVNEEQGILYRRKITLPEDRRPQVRQSVEAALETIARLAGDFALPVQVYDNTASLRGSMAILRSDLYDVLAEKLQRYGAVDPRLEAALDPYVWELIQLLQAISQTAQA